MDQTLTGNNSKVKQKLSEGRPGMN